MRTHNTNHSFDQILVTLQGAENILVTSHIRPDGDALGCTIACALWLSNLGKRVVAWNEDGLPQKFTYLPSHSLVTSPTAEKKSFDVVLAVDSSSRDRLGKVLDSVISLGVLINIDHHISNHYYGDLNFVDPSAAATGQILFDLFCHAGVHFTPEISTNLYAAISTDTGSFQYPATTPHTFEVAASLLRSGVQTSKISQAIYDTQPRRRLNLLRHALNNIQFHCGDTIASFSLSLADSQQLQILPEDTEGVIDHLRSIEGVLVAIFFEEVPEGKVRISIRSKDPACIDVCKICEKFGGGGHAAASGARVKGSLTSIQQQFITTTCHEIQKLT